MVFRQHSFASSGTTLRTISFESTGREGVYTKYKGRVMARVVCRWLLDEVEGVENVRKNISRLAKMNDLPGT
jgi:hypothetical protein